MHAIILTDTIKSLNQSKKQVNAMFHLTYIHER